VEAHILLITLFHKDHTDFAKWKLVVSDFTHYTLLVFWHITDVPMQKFRLLYLYKHNLRVETLTLHLSVNIM